MTKKDFMKWVEQMEKKVDYKRYFSYLLPNNLRTTICYDKKTGKIGVARCYPKDRFNKAIGKAISYARCVGIEVPEFHDEKRFSEMKYLDKFYTMYKGRRTEFIFLGKLRNSEWLAYPITDPNYLSHFYFNAQFEMVE